MEIFVFTFYTIIIIIPDFIMECVVNVAPLNSCKSVIWFHC
jgi:hypothetical protein